MDHIMNTLQSVINILHQQLSLDISKAQLTAETPLMGAMPEFDSVSVVNILTAFEDQFGLLIEDEDLDAEIFTTIGSLVEFVKQKQS